MISVVVVSELNTAIFCLIFVSWICPEKLFFSSVSDNRQQDRLQDTRWVGWLIRLDFFNCFVSNPGVMNASVSYLNFWSVCQQQFPVFVHPVCRHGGGLGQVTPKHNVKYQHVGEPFEFKVISFSIRGLQFAPTQTCKERDFFVNLTPCSSLIFWTNIFHSAYT